MKQWFLDTNVLIDFLTGRQPFADAAASLFELARQHSVQLYAASLSFATVYYIVRQAETHERTLFLLAQLEKLVQILPVDATIIRAAINSEFRDFEDALQYFTARTVPLLDTIVTRNAKDFRAGSLLVLSPTAAVAQLL